jgi:hypothetical protein
MAMCVIHMRVQCSDTFNEVILDDVEQTELTVEALIGTALLQVFNEISVENITLKVSRQRYRGDDGQGSAGYENPWV